MKALAGRSRKPIAVDEGRFLAREAAKLQFPEVAIGKCSDLSDAVSTVLSALEMEPLVDVSLRRAGVCGSSLEVGFVLRPDGQRPVIVHIDPCLHTSEIFDSQVEELLALCADEKIHLLRFGCDVHCSDVESLVTSFLGKCESTELGKNQRVKGALHNYVHGSKRAQVLDQRLLVCTGGKVRLADTSAYDDLPEHLDFLPGDGSELFYSGLIEKYCSRPRELRHVTYPCYYSDYRILDANKPVPAKLKTRRLLRDLEGRRVLKRDVPQVCRWHTKLPSSDKDAFFYQQLLLNCPFVYEQGLLSPDNSRIGKDDQWREECFLRKVVKPMESELDLMGRMLADSNNPAVQKKLSRAMDRCDRAVAGGVDVAEIERLMNVIKKKCPVEDWSHVSPKISYSDCSPSQKKALYNIMLKQSAGQSLSVLVGGAGCGKSTLINLLSQLFTSQGKKVALTGMSGACASLIGGSTVHYFAGLGIDLDASRVKASRKAALSEVDILVIDECSMCTDALLCTLDRVLREARGCEKPYGGVGILLVGDPYQLPPVIEMQKGVGGGVASGPSGKQREKKKNAPAKPVAHDRPPRASASLCEDDGSPLPPPPLPPTSLSRSPPEVPSVPRSGSCGGVRSPAVPDQNYHFLGSMSGSPLWFGPALDQFDKYVLTGNKRVSEDGWASMLADLRVGKRSAELMAALESRFLPYAAALEKAKDERTMVLGSRRYMVDAVNSKFTEGDEGAEFVWKSVDTDICNRPIDDVAMTMLEKGARLHAEVRLRVGDPVMVLKNIDVGAGIVNGMTGTVAKVYPDYKCVRVKRDRPGPKSITSDVYLYPTREVVNVRGQRVLQRRQLPCTLAHGATCHKLQGAEFDKLVVNLAETTHPGALYCALSRCKSLDGLTITHSDADKFSSALVAKAHVTDTRLPSVLGGYASSMNELAAPPSDYDPLAVIAANAESSMRAAVSGPSWCKCGNCVYTASKLPGKCCGKPPAECKSVVCRDKLDEWLDYDDKDVLDQTHTYHTWPLSVGEMSYEQHILMGYRVCFRTLHGIGHLHEKISLPSCCVKIAIEGARKNARAYGVSKTEKGGDERRVPADSAGPHMAQMAAVLVAAHCMVNTVKGRSKVKKTKKPGKKSKHGKKPLSKRSSLPPLPSRADLEADLAVVFSEFLGGDSLVVTLEERRAIGKKFMYNELGHSGVCAFDDALLWPRNHDVDWNVRACPLEMGPGDDASCISGGPIHSTFKLADSCGVDCMWMCFVAWHTYYLSWDCSSLDCRGDPDVVDALPVSFVRRSVSGFLYALLQLCPVIGEALTFKAQQFSKLVVWWAVSSAHPAAKSSVPFDRGGNNYMLVWSIFEPFMWAFGSFVSSHKVLCSECNELTTLRCKHGWVEIKENHWSFSLQSGPVGSTLSDLVLRAVKDQSVKSCDDPRLRCNNHPSKLSLYDYPGSTELESLSRHFFVKVDINQVDKITEPICEPTIDVHLRVDVDGRPCDRYLDRLVFHVNQRTHFNMYVWIPGVGSLKQGWYFYDGLTDRDKSIRNSPVGNCVYLDGGLPPVLDIDSLCLLTYSEYLCADTRPSLVGGSRFVSSAINPSLSLSSVFADDFSELHSGLWYTYVASAVDGDETGVLGVRGSMLCAPVIRACDFFLLNQSKCLNDEVMNVFSEFLDRRDTDWSKTKPSHKPCVVLGTHFGELLKPVTKTKTNDGLIEVNVHDRRGVVRAASRCIRKAFTRKLAAISGNGREFTAGDFGGIVFAVNVNFSEASGKYTHWCPVHVDLGKRGNPISVLDSGWRFSSGDAHNEHIGMLGVLQSALIESFSFFGILKASTDFGFDFAVTENGAPCGCGRSHGNSQQKNEDECGVFSLKTMDCLSAGYSAVIGPSDEDQQSYRRYIAFSVLSVNHVAGVGEESLPSVCRIYQSIDDGESVLSNQVVNSSDCEDDNCIVASGGVSMQR
jgi:energy-coupling factor transporter ATP-binding protein EcfA2